MMLLIRVVIDSPRENAHHFLKANQTDSDETTGSLL